MSDLYLFVGYLYGVLEDGPDDYFVAGWSGEGAFVAEEVLCIGRQHILKGEWLDFSLRVCK